MTTAPDPLVVTTETVAGHRIVRTIGCVYSIGHFGWKGDWKSPLPELIARAKEKGANAVVGTRWNERNLIYGTAVVIEPEARLKP
jgi:uncharacterized protein YbjQ (UPF0145 family)